MESHQVAAGSRGFGRWGSAEFHRPPGHRKQGGWHMFPENSSHSYNPLRSADQLMEEETGRRSNFRVDGKYNRIYRDNGASFGQREWKGANSWEDGNGRPIDVCNNQRSVDGLPHTSGRRMFTDEAGHSFMRSRSADKLVEEEDGSRSTFRGNGKYSRNYRENRGSSGQRDWKSPNSWENSNGRPVDVGSSQRSVDGLPHATCRPIFVEDPSHSYMPLRSAEKLMKEDSGRRSTFRDYGKYNRNYRDNKGYFGLRVWKGSDTWESNSGRPVDVNQRSVDELTHASSRHVPAEEPAHGYMLPRSVDKLMEEESAHRSTFRGDGKYNRNYRDNRGSFRQRYSKDAKSLENGTGRLIDVSDDQKSVDGLPHVSCPQSDCGNACDSHPVDSKEHDNVLNDGNILSTGQKCEKDNSLAMMDWKPLKWSWSGSLSSRSSGLGHSSSSKSRGAMNSGEVKGGTVAKDVTPVTSPIGRLIDVSDDQKSVDGFPHVSCPQSYCGNACDSHPVNSKEHDDVLNDGNILSTGQKCEKDNSLSMMDWMPLKWSRSGSLSSRGSGLGHSSSSKSMGAMNSGEVKVGTVAKDVTPVTSPTGDAATSVASAAPVEDMNANKKPRLGWGEGLAKYEKKKVEGMDEVDPKLCESVNSIGGTSLVSKSPIVTGISDCASPATPSSVDDSYSPGLEEKSFPKNSCGHSDFSNICRSPVPVTRDLFEVFSFHLEKMDASSIANLGLSLVEMLQSDDPYSVESGFMRSPTLKKLFLWRSDVMRALEATEFEIDSLENELKSLVNLSRGDNRGPELSSSLTEAQESPGELSGNSFRVPRPAPLEIADMDERTLPLDDGRGKKILSTVKNDDGDSPGTATSKYNEPSFLACPVLAETSQQRMDLDSIDTAVTSGEERKSDNLVTTGDEEAEPCASKCDSRIPENIGAESWMSEGKNSGQLKDRSIMNEGSMLSDFVISTNKETARRASEVINKLFPDGECKVDTSSSAGTATLLIDSLILRKFTMRKQSSRFKERVLALKYKAFGQLWKADLHQLSLRKCRAKSQKKCDSGLRVSLNGYQKHRSSIRPCLTSPGNMTPASAAETVSCTSKMLADSQVKIYRKNLTMPVLILDDREKTASRFVTTNGLIEDPCALEKEKEMINPWTIEEREIFLDKLAIFGKNFRRIASFLDHKTTADCVEFYYKNHKSDCFERTMSKLDSGKQGKSLSMTTYLKTSEKRCPREVNSIPLEVLGAASVIVSEADNKMLDCDVCALPFTSDGCNDSRLSRIDCGDDTSSFGAYASEQEAVAADILAGIGCSWSSEAMSSCITTCVDPVEKGHRRMKFAVKRPLTPDLSEKMEEETCSGESCGEMDPSDWTDEEKSAFIQAVSAYGKDFTMILRIVGTRSLDQCKVFFSKGRKCLGLDLLRPKTSITGTSFSNDADRGDSDSEDVCNVVTSAVCDDRSGSKTVEDLSLTVADATVVESAVSKSVNLQTDLNETDTDAGMQHFDAAEEKDVKVIAADDRLLKNGQSPSTLPGLHHSAAVSFMYADVLEDRMTAEIAVHHGAVPLKENADCKPVGSAPVDHTFSSPVDHEGTKDSFPGEESVVVSDALMTSRSSTVVGSRKGFDPLSSSCKVSATTPDLGGGFKSEPSLKGSFGITPVEVLADSLLHKRSCEIVLSASQDGSAIPAAMDRALLTAVGLPSGRHMMRNGDHSILASGNSLLSSNEHLRIQRDLPVQMPSQGIIGDSHRVNVSAVPNFIKTEDNAGHQYIPKDGVFCKSGATKSDYFMAELPLLPPKSEQPNCVPSGLGLSSSEEEQNKEKPSGSGDFKLFGQILSHSPSNLKSKSIVENGFHQKVSSKPSVLKPCGNRGVDRNSPDPSNSMNLQNVPLRSYGFWDGNRIQTGLPSLPDSAILLAKYPAAFGKYPMSSAKLEQLSLQARNECHANGLSAFTSREVASNNGGIMDYLSLSSREDAKVQPFTIDVKKQRMDACPDVPRCSSFETIPILQQHQGTGGMIAMNVMGRGLPYNGISDPVAALKMHYAQLEQYVGQNVNVNVIREDESWRSKGDFGR